MTSEHGVSSSLSGQSSSDASTPELGVPQQPRVALVTGAARRIGASISRALHQRGLNIALHCRDSSTEAEALAAQLNTLRANSAAVFRADLADLAQLEQLPAQVATQWGRLDVLVHNASSFYATPIGQASAADWDDLFASNLRGPFFLSQAAAPLLRASTGCIVSLVDIHAQRPLRDHSIYCIAKAGLQMMTLSLAKELAPQVRVNGIAPGYILTPPQGMDENVHRTILDRTALARRGEPEDIAGAVVYLALDAPYVSGQILAVDGGRSLHL